MSCLFCRIVAGEIPAKRVYEDEELLAFEDIKPEAPTHVLIIPKRHVATLNDLQQIDDSMIGAMVRRASSHRERARPRLSGLSHGVQHQRSRRPDGLPHPPASAGGAPFLLATRVITYGLADIARAHALAPIRSRQRDSHDRSSSRRSHACGFAIPRRRRAHLAASR